LSSAMSSAATDPKTPQPSSRVLGTRILKVARIVFPILIGLYLIFVLLSVAFFKGGFSGEMKPSAEKAPRRARQGQRR
jgi:hypothetical protein